MLHVETFCGGMDKNLCYLVWDPDTKEAAILDTDVDPQLPLQKAEELGLSIQFAFVMHSHGDHLVGLESYKAQNIPLMGHKGCKAEVDMRVHEGDKLQIGNNELEVIFAPGHHVDCVMLYGDAKVFTTDVVFVGGCGRCDFAQSNVEQQWESLQKFAQLPDETVVYPGHDYGSTQTSTVKREKEENRFLVCKNKEEFIEKRMG